MSSHPEGSPFARWGPNVAARRRQLGLTGAELSRRVGITAKHLSQIENGNSLPSYDVQVRIADVLNGLTPDSAVSTLFPRTLREAELEGIAAEHDTLLERVGGGCS